METPTKLPFSPNNILARLEELKRWQHEQEQRLKQRQIKQRELLSNEQRRMCQAFDLIATNSFISTSSDESETDQSSVRSDNDKNSEYDENNEIENSEQIENLSLRNNDYVESSECQENSLKNINETTQFQNCVNSNINLDEMPINPRKNNIVFESENSIVQENKMQDNKPKFKYLKRGEGLARFRMTKEDVMRNRQKALEKSKYVNKRSKKLKSNIKSVPTFKPTLPERFTEKKTTVMFTEPKSTKPSIKSNEPTWTHIISDSALTKPSTSNNIENRPRPGPYSVITSDAYYKLLEELKQNRDKEELKIFELLEDKIAHNSSIDSSSSVMHMLQNQSTPQLERMLHAATRQAQQHSNITNRSPPASQRQLFTENEKENLNESLHVKFDEINLIDKNDTRSQSSDSESADETANNHPVIAGEQDSKFNDESEWSDGDSSSTESIEIENKTEKKLLTQENENVVNLNHQVNDEVKQLGIEESAIETDDETILKSDLLKKRLSELENEIKTFRQENATLIRRRQLLDNERRRFLKEKTEKEKQLAEEQKRLTHQIDEEKRKLFKEKMVFEKYVKESKNQPTRKEREEITLLKDEIKTLKEKIKVTETKYGASQARLRTQIRQLEKELSNAKSEIENLRKENKRLLSVQARKSGISNTKVLHEINKNLSKILPKALAENKLIALEDEEKQKHQNQKVANQKPRTSKVQEIQAESSSSSESDEPENKIVSVRSKTKQINQKSSEISSLEESNDEEEEKNPKKSSSVKSVLYDTMYPNTKHSYFPGNDVEIKQRSNLLFEKKSQKTNEHHVFNMKENDFNYANRSAPTTNRASFENYDVQFNKSDPIIQRPSYHPEAFTSSSTNNMNDEFQNVRDKYISNIEEIYERTFGKSRENSKPSTVTSCTTEALRADEKSETVLPDGSKEIHYPNGNMKHVSPDGNIIKLTYYNGDIKKTDLNNGIIKYFFAKTKTTHTTFPDGFEILEFSNGQTEKRFKDGRIEIDFPNGYRKLVDSKGNETWYYSDGTRVTTKINGEKIIELPNGQKEIHTDQHKRREYPDGTVKILYPDNTTETRYANGRIRIKDKTGRLIMDHQR